MGELKTIAKSDPAFSSYLLGTFSKDDRAISVKSLNVATAAETVTFEIIPLAEIKAPFFLRKWALTLKIKNYFLLYFPMFLIISKNLMDNVPFDPRLALWSLLAATFLFAAMNLRNDFRDHLSGLDRIHPDSGSRAIQKGWITAHQAKNLSTAFAVLGIACALPAVIGLPELLLVIGVIALLAIFGLSVYPHGLKYRLWTEGFAFLLLGPLLTVGFQMAIGAPFDLESVFLGIITGWLAVYIVHLKNFEAIMVNNQAGFTNSVGIMGFEKGKRLMAVWWISLLVLIDVYHWIYNSLFWTVSFIVISLALSWALLKYLRTLTSPVASTFKIALDRCRQLGIFMIYLWILENISYLLVIELASR